jgi:hypothetical protein
LRKRLLLMIGTLPSDRCVRSSVAILGFPLSHLAGSSGGGVGCGDSCRESGTPRPDRLRMSVHVPRETITATTTRTMRVRG